MLKDKAIQSDKLVLIASLLSLQSHTTPDITRRSPIRAVSETCNTK